MRTAAWKERAHASGGYGSHAGGGDEQSWDGIEVHSRRPVAQRSSANENNVERHDGAQKDELGPWAASFARRTAYSGSAMY